MLEAAGVSVLAAPASIDERAVEEVHLAAGGALSDVAVVLARAKALAVSRDRPDALVLGADQTLSFAGGLLHKAATPAEALMALKALAGQSHHLTSAFALARNGAILADGASHVTMRMRRLSEAALARYGQEAGEALTATVGGYQLEGLGAQLFDAVDGDYFTVLGLPLLQVLAQLRALGAMPD
jgi:septum formation protein